jgi:hypothetical protein
MFNIAVCTNKPHQFSMKEACELTPLSFLVREGKHQRTYEISSSYDGEYDDHCLLRCCTVVVSSNFIDVLEVLTASIIITHKKAGCDIGAGQSGVPQLQLYHWLLALSIFTPILPPILWFGQASALFCLLLYQHTFMCMNYSP